MEAKKLWWRSEEVRSEQPDASKINKVLVPGAVSPRIKSDGVPRK